MENPRQRRRGVLACKGKGDCVCVCVCVCARAWVVRRDRESATSAVKASQTNREVMQRGIAGKARRRRDIGGIGGRILFNQKKKEWWKVEVV